MNHQEYTLRLVFWELTARCNLKCRHCRAEAQEDFAAGELTTGDILRVAREIRENADPIMVLTGGEPLERPDFFTIAEECCRLFTRVAIATNGTTVDDAVARRLVEIGVQRASISLDGAQPETHDAFRGIQGSFDAALRGFDALRRAGLSVQVNMTVTRHNDREVEDLLQLVLARGADAFHVFMLVPVGCGVEINDSARLTPERSEEILRWLAEQSLEQRDRIFMKATCAPQYFRILREVARDRGIQLPHHGSSGMSALTRGCLAGSGVCFISRLGDVQPCGYLPVMAGNVRTQKLGAIWRESPLFAVLRDPDALEGKCGICPFRRVCLGCRARAYAENGNYLGEEPDCPYQPPVRAGGQAHG